MGPPIKELIPAFKKIQENNKNLIISFTEINLDLDLFEEEVKTVCQNLSYKGLCLHINANNVMDGKKRLEIANRISKLEQSH